MSDQWAATPALAHRYSRFFDSASPLGGDIGSYGWYPGIPRGQLGGYYVNGSTWSDSEIDRMLAVFGISVDPYNTSFASVARCIDIETGTLNSISDIATVVPAFIAARRSHGHDDATVYTTRSLWGACHSAAKAHGYSPRYWIATGDGTMSVSPSQWGAVGANVWAVQYLFAPHQYAGQNVSTNANYDLSILYGVNDMVHPSALD